MGATKKSQAELLNARCVGSGEITLVLSHGYGANQTIWDQIVPRLADKCRVVLFDWDFAAASGDSTFHTYAKNLTDLLDEMALGRVVFVGHSMAGMVGCVATAERPDLFRRIVLVGASPRYLNSDDYEGGFEMAELETIFAAIEQDFNSWATNFAAAMVGPSPPGMAERFGETLKKMNPRIALSLAKTIFLSDLRAVLSSVKVPCTVINGKRDPVVPMPAADFIRRRLAGEASLVALDFDGHFPQLTAPNILLEALYLAIACELVEVNLSA